jgi:hypothetical protein
MKLELYTHAGMSPSFDASKMAFWKSHPVTRHKGRLRPLILGGRFSLAIFMDISETSRATEDISAIAEKIPTVSDSLHLFA